MHHQHDQERWTKALQQHAAHASFPEWEPQDGDWTSLHTSFTPNGNPYTEVAVYRGHDRIHYRRITGDELEPFWLAVINAHGET